jgi:CspA family cold shock protein
MMGWHQFE